MNPTAINTPTTATPVNRSVGRTPYRNPRQKGRQRPGQGEAEDGPPGEQPKPASRHPPDEAGPVGPERHPHADLLPPFTHAGRQDPIHAEHCQEHGRRRERQ